MNPIIPREGTCKDEVVSVHAMNARDGLEVQQYSLLTSALNGGGWSASRPGRFTLRKSVPSNHSKEGWVSSRANLDTFE